MPTLIQATQPQRQIIISKELTVSPTFWNHFLFSWMHQTIMNVGYYPPMTQIVSAISNFPPQLVKILGEMIKREERLKLENNCREKKSFHYFRNFCTESSPLLLFSRYWISLLSKISNSLKGTFVDMNSMLPGALFVSHIIHIFCILYVFFIVLSKAMFWLHLRLPIRGQGFCR